MYSEKNMKLSASLVKSLAKNIGFSACGITKITKLVNAGAELKKWVYKGMHGEMSYMEKNMDKRTNPSLLLDDAKSVISLLYNYYPQQKTGDGDDFKIAMYAYGIDYHFVIKQKLDLLIQGIRTVKDSFHAISYVDTGPVMEKVWAQKAGLGWIGKNSCLINPKKGSYHFIGEIITSEEFEYDIEGRDFCGSCTKCIDACPTGAIIEPYVLNAEKCISYLTIEYKGKLPEGLQSAFSGYIFGCDICQEVCPWNKLSQPHQEPSFVPEPSFASMKPADWINLTEKKFREIFKKSAVKRTKYSGLRRNIDYLM